MTRNTRSSHLAAAAVVIGITSPGAARADDGTPPADSAANQAAPSARAPEKRREVDLAFGYGAIVARGGVQVYTLANNAEPTAALGGFNVDVTRRVDHFSLGARFWRMGNSSDGRGSAAHVLTRLSTQARFHPWILRTLEPWVGVELGLALAEDFAVWNKTDQEAAHVATVGVRPAFAGGLEAGAQLRLGSIIALGLRGGLLYMGFDPAKDKVAESPSSAKFFVYPTDYGRRIWLSMALTAELTVPD